MNKQELSYLEKAWEAEIAHSLKEIDYPIFQSKSNVVKQLAEDGYLRYIEFTDRGITFKGYQITHYGRMTYCESLPRE